MKIVLSFLLTISCAVAIGAEKKKIVRKVAQVESVAPSAKVLLQFLSCRKDMLEASDSSWISCINSSTVEAPDRRRTFSQFLFNPYDYKKIRDCDKQEIDSMRSFTEFKDLVTCFEYEDGGIKRVGAAFFINVDGKPKLFSLFRLKD